MARKRRRSKGGRGRGPASGGGGGALGSLRGGFRSVARGAAGVSRRGAPRKSSTVLNVALVLAVAAAGYFLLRRFGILR